MLRFALKYRTVIDSVTADKALKLHKYELDNDEWKIVGDLVLVLEVSLRLSHHSQTNIVIAI
jgi:hypothetical protein